MLDVNMSQAGKFEGLAVEGAGQFVAGDLDVGDFLLHRAHGFLGLLHDGVRRGLVYAFHLEHREIEILGVELECQRVVLERVLACSLSFHLDAGGR